jgi:Leucine-rich repeat (LRR) protein
VWTFDRLLKWEEAPMTAVGVIEKAGWRGVSALALLLLPAGVSAQPCSRPEQVVRIDDAGLRRALLEKIEATDAAELTCAALDAVASLDARGLQIASLAGLQHARHLARLDLGDNRIRDLTSLTALEHVTLLRLDGNLISDLRPLLKNKFMASGLTLDVRRNCLDLAEESAASKALQQLEERDVALEYRPQKQADACP